MEDAPTAALLDLAYDKLLVSTGFQDEAIIVAEYALALSGTTLTLAAPLPASVPAGLASGGLHASFEFLHAASSSRTHLTTFYLSKVPSTEVAAGQHILHSSFVTYPLGVEITGGDQADGDAIFLAPDCSALTSADSFSSAGGALIRANREYASTGVTVPTSPPGLHYLCYRSVIQTELTPSSLEAYNLLQAAGSSYFICTTPPHIVNAASTLVVTES